jgi:protein ImuA
MAAEKPNIAVLKASLARLEAAPGDGQPTVSLGISWIDQTLRGGLRRGALHEVYATRPGDEAAASGFATAIAARLAGRRAILWIRQDFSALEYGELAATGFLELGIDPARLTLLRASDVNDALRAASDALTCAGLGAVVLELRGQAKALDLVASRKLTLGAAQKSVSVVLLRFAAKPQASSAETRWRVAAQTSTAASQQQDDWGRPRFAAELLRNRHGRLGHWVMEWNGDEGSFTADRRAVVPASADRPPQTAVEGTREGNHRAVS